MKIQFIMKKPFRPSALPPAAKLLAIVGLIAMPYVVLTSMRTEAPPVPLAGATFSIGNGTICPFAAIIHHSGACPAVTIPSTTVLPIPASSSGVSVTVGGSFINKVDIWDGTQVIATWTCTSGTSGAWSTYVYSCPLQGWPGYYAHLQGNGYDSNKIEYELW